MAALYNRVSIFDKVIYAGILAFSIYDYARLIDTGSVDRTVALLCLLLNCVIMYVIYSLVKICMTWLSHTLLTSEMKSLMKAMTGFRLSYHIPNQK